MARPRPRRARADRIPAQPSEPRGLLRPDSAGLSRRPVSQGRPAAGAAAAAGAGQTRRGSTSAPAAAATRCPWRCTVRRVYAVEPSAGMREQLAAAISEHGVDEHRDLRRALAIDSERRAGRRRRLHEPGRLRHRGHRAVRRPARSAHAAHVRRHAVRQHATQVLRAAVAVGARRAARGVAGPG